MSREELLKVVRELYDEFFCDLGINPKTGEVPVGRLVCDRRFACYPYVGSRYGQDDEKRLLVVGLDIGADKKKDAAPDCHEGCGTGRVIECFECRRSSIEDRRLRHHNPHIAGTYFTAMRYPHPMKEWENCKGLEKPCQQILKEEEEGDGLPNTNPLSRIALTNSYKWVTTDGKDMSTTLNRTNFCREREERLLADEVRCLKPDVVVFQGADFQKPQFEWLRSSVHEAGAEWHIPYHPSRHPSESAPWHRWPCEVVRPLESSLTAT
ncbi:hypothetical protein [Candidatus Palauibacter sp.]|uniref:hypothetical protein n=1 Tax=Candidatus Palauibacter sp. TaxID=3101350 RepID=UPI003B52DF9B